MNFIKTYICSTVGLYNFLVRIKLLKVRENTFLPKGYAKNLDSEEAFIIANPEQYEILLNL